MKMKAIIPCILCMLFSLLPVTEAEPSVLVPSVLVLEPSVLVLEGDAVEIACPTIESYDSYFWRKGDSIKDSTEVASFVDNVPRAISENYAVTANGTFFIKNVTTKDEGKYFCRGVTDISSSTVKIIVQVQASLQNFQLSIDHCDTEISCFRYIDFSKLIELICMAKNASPSMMLKWFNGSREIESNITVVNNQKDAPPSTTIRSTIKAVYRTPVTLTCQAVDTKSKTNGGRFVNIRLEQQVPITNEKPPAPDQDLGGRGWKITALILLVFCIIVLIMGMYMMHRSERYWQNGRPSVPDNGSIPTGSVSVGSNYGLSWMSEGE